MWSGESMQVSSSNGTNDLKQTHSIEDLINNCNTGLDNRKLGSRTKISNQQSINSNKPLRRPLHAVRPTPISTSMLIKSNGTALPKLALERACLLPVFRQLSASDLARCARVCRQWSRISVDPSLWRCIDVTRKRLSASCLGGIVRRQPDTLILNWTAVAKRQLAWLLTRLPQMKHLSVQGCPWSGVAAIRMCICPPLVSLDLSYVFGMNDGFLRDLLSPPRDSRPGLVDTKSRLRHLHTLKMASCDISDVSLRYVVQNLPNLGRLDISCCLRLTDAGVAQLATMPAPTITTLTTLNLFGCRLLTDAALEHLTRCVALVNLDIRQTPNISQVAIFNFLHGTTDFCVSDDKLFKKVKPL